MPEGIVDGPARISKPDPRSTIRSKFVNDEYVTCRFCRPLSDLSTSKPFFRCLNTRLRHGEPIAVTCLAMSGTKGCSYDERGGASLEGSFL